MINISQLKVALLHDYLPQEVKITPSDNEAIISEPEQLLKLALDKQLREAIIDKLQIKAEELVSYTVFKRSYDARKVRQILLIYNVDVNLTNEEEILNKFKDDSLISIAKERSYKFPLSFTGQLPQNVKRPIIIGFGPCGLFSALLLSQMGLRPIVLERGYDVRQRTQDTWGLWRKNIFKADSNVQFGEGGAGTFSDGKLYSQIKDPLFRGRKVLEEFVKFGADPEILSVSKPHIGTFRLVGMIEKMRAEIIALGGEIRFGAHVVDINIKKIAENLVATGVTLKDGQHLESDHIALALGHSARDTFEMLYEKQVYMEAKPFSIGFRIEHPQSLIDEARFGSYAGNPVLGAADYDLVYHASNGRSVYSFCMCPGGTVVAATSEENCVVTNGMSQYSRNERNANSGIVVGIDPADYPGGPLAGIALQRQYESIAFDLGGGDYSAPAQLVGDFVAGIPSKNLGRVVPSYKPGVRLGDLSSALPDYAIDAIREALPEFAKQVKGYFKYDAILTGVETRTSSPLRMTRDDDSLQSINVAGLYPAGEGSGYAGGILSAGVDGIKVAEAVAKSILAQ